MRLLLLMVGASCLMAGCGKKPKDVAKNNNDNTGGGGDGLMAVDGGRVVNAGGGGQPNPQPAPQGGGGGNTNFQPGGGAVQNVRKAGLRTINLNEMKQLGLYVTTAADDFGKMPTAAEIRQLVEQQDKSMCSAINDGWIILTNTTNRGAIWAYEVDADKKGGIVLVAGTASRASADEVKQYLASK